MVQIVTTNMVYAVHEVDQRGEHNPGALGVVRGACRNIKIFEEGLERPDYVVQKYDDEKNFQYVSCIGEIEPV
ncbi:hypothetical protein INT46_009601, partial [Mucor plumbeus]